MPAGPLGTFVGFGSPIAARCQRSGNCERRNGQGATDGAPTQCHRSEASSTGPRLRGFPALALENGQLKERLDAASPKVRPSHGRAEPVVESMQGRM